MNPDHQALVRGSFAKIIPISTRAASLFYHRLFELNPQLRSLFKGDLEEQGRKLMALLGLVVADIHRLNELLPTVRELGRRHATYGVTDPDYETVASALLWTLEQGLGCDFTADTRDAWIACYSLLASEMRSAASEQELPVLPPR